MKDINYYNTFIAVAEDCPVETAQLPVSKQGAEIVSVPVLQYELIAQHPYTYTQEDILFEVYARRNQIPEEDRVTEREKFFSKSQACLRTSSLCKRYGWGLHHDAEGRVACYAVESEEYKRLAADPALKQLRAMRSSRKTV